ncbi:MAG: PLAT/LH2 domain-containing protein [Opitutaceae bacterium]
MKLHLLLCLSLVSLLAAETTITVTTMTGKEVGSGTNKVAFIQINGEGKKYKLDNDDANDHERGATDIFTDIAVPEEMDTIEYIELSIIGDDPWLLKSIEFEFKQDGEKSGTAKFRRKEWLAGFDQGNLRTRPSAHYQLKDRIK